MKRGISILFGLICLFANTDASVSGQAKVESFTSISRREIELLLTDVAKTNPTVIKKLAADPEMKRQQIENLRQLLAFASQARKDGLDSGPINTQEMDNVRSEVIAVNYDREINKNKGPMPPFGFITDDQVAKYWVGSDHEPEFKRFLDAKIAILKASDPETNNREISDDEKNQARDIFAKTRIYLAEFELKRKNRTLPTDFIEKADLQVKLQQAQFLARLYSDKIADKFRATDAEVAAYIAANPEFDPAVKRATAQKILDRAKAGENFAALANEFTQDPGNIGQDGIAQGGIYKDVPMGRMVAPFEAAAIALEPGQIAPNLVESDFGFHIIKLERKGKAAGQTELTYDVRHILISTGVTDPDKPTAREVPVKDYVRSKLETDKEKRLLDELIVSNNIQVPEDFTVPALASEPVKKKVTKRRPVRRK